MTRLAVIGAGKMGRLVAALAPEMGFELVATLGEERTRGGITRDALAGAEVAVEFTVPAAAAGVIRDCAAAGVPVVSGTTGWDADRASVESDVRSSTGALLWAPNFAIGAHLFSKLVAEAARQFEKVGQQFDVHLIETHHAQKLDAPSGTARLLAGVAERAGGRAVPITSVRTGQVPGTHEIVFDAPFEQVRLVHEARDRRVFAAGALTAARWLVGRRGVFTLDDFLGEIAR
ncbi:MAG: dihydrodipicolinate reductase [Gemmatimonadetes bacterium]|nr:dihydrodipicolinate reductase [Gemmatimonadota bacterium]